MALVYLVVQNIPTIQRRTVLFLPGCFEIWFSPQLSNLPQFTDKPLAITHPSRPSEHRTLYH